MLFTEAKQAFWMAWKNVKVNKGRSFLTMLGILIGIASVITVISVGAGAQSLILDQIKSYGSNLIGILPGNTGDEGPPAAVLGIEVTTLKYEDAMALQDPRNVPQVEAVTAYVKGVGTVTHGNLSKETAAFNGVMADYIRVENVAIEEGRFFNQSEEKAYARVVVLGKAVKEELFGVNEDPIGKSIKIKRESFRVVGILESRGSSGFMNRDDQVFVPLTTAQKLLLGIKHVNMVRLKVRDENYVEQTIEDVKVTLRHRHRIKQVGDDDFTVRSQAQALSVLTSVTDVLRFFLAIIAAISLLVGGIGIMNIMYVVVTERTREIGLRKAVGARQKQVLYHFLTEAVVLSGMGGIVGILGGVLISALIASVVNYLGYEWALVISLQAIFLAFVITSVIGVVFGYYPARRAAHLDPIEALRYE